jgi:methylmalonyl-CoA epimerase
MDIKLLIKNKILTTMKRKTLQITSILLTFLGGIIFSSFIINQKKDDMLESKKMAQVGIIVPDIEKAVTSYAKLFGVDEPDIIQAANPEDNPTTYKGELTDASCKLAFFNLENIQLELIEPIGKPSTWNDFLEKTGGGIHHIAFWITGMDGQVKKLKMLDIDEVQHGGWDGGQYSYLETPENMGIVIELLENFND